MASLPLPAQWQPQNSFTAAPSINGATASPARLSALEWSIVAMAETDPVSSIREPGRFIAALESIFGLKRAGRLANERLEALRRLAILAWRHRWNLPKSELAAFLSVGFSIDQYELVQTSIGQARNRVQRRTVR